MFKICGLQIRKDGCSRHADYKSARTGNGIIDKSKWEGLSGSPFFDTKGGLVGMIIRVLHGGNLLWVLPMNEILKKAKLFIDVDNLQS